MSIFPEQRSTDSVEVGEESFIVYELSAWDHTRFFEAHVSGLAMAAGHPGKIVKHHKRMEVMLVAMALRPGYPDRPEEELTEDAQNLPDKDLQRVFDKAADLSGIDFDREEHDAEEVAKKIEPKSHQ